MLACTRCIIAFSIYVFLHVVLCIFPPHVHVYIWAYDLVSIQVLLITCIYLSSRHRHCTPCALVVTMISSSTSSGHVPVLRCLVLFNDTNYCDWVPRMRGLRLWEFLTGELLCLPSPTTPTQLVIPKQTIDDTKEKLLANYDDHLSGFL
jgi:hypothetical protein